MAPDMLPTMNTMIVVVSRRPKVQGSESPISFITGVGKDTSEGPKSPVKSLRQNARYCCPRGRSRPYISFIAWTVSSAALGSTAPRDWIWATARSTGPTGISRGRKKIIVIPSTVTPTH